MPDKLPNLPEEVSPDAEGRMEAFFFAHARTGSCPPLNLLFAAEEDVLSVSAGSSIRTHIAGCSLCQTILAELDPSNAALAPEADGRIRARIESRVARPSALMHMSGTTRRYLFALAAILILGSLGIFSYRLVHSSTEERLAVIPYHTSPGERPLPDLAELHRIAPLAPPDDVPALVMRGSSTAHGPTVHDLMPPFRAYNRENFAAAATGFAALAKRFPDSQIPPLYLGVSQLELSENDDAQRSLERAYYLSGPAQDDAAWYLAIADLRLDKPQVATPLLHDLCEHDHNSYTARACTIVRQIGPS
jgi:hypothetical protein